MPRATAPEEHRDRTATEERTEHSGERTEDQTEHRTNYPAEDRDNSYLAANQHMVKFTSELRGINEQAALDFDRRKNPADYDLKEKQEMVEAVTEAFNAANWNSAGERRQAADDVAQNLYQSMYPRVEVAEAAAQHKLPEEFLEALKKENVEYFALKKDGETGAEGLTFRVKDLETAQRMAEMSGGAFHVVSTRNLDHYRDQFADALYSSDKHEDAKKLMEGSLDDAIRYYNGDLSHVRRWDKPLEESAGLSEQEHRGEGESDRRQAEGRYEGQLDPSYQELAAFRNLESMDEYTLDHAVRDLLNEKLGHTQEYLAELQVNQHPDAKAVAQVHEALHELGHEGIRESVEKGNDENFVAFLRHIEDADRELALDQRERNGFIGGENYVQPKPPEDFTNLESISNYAREVREQINEQRGEMPPLNYDIADKLLERLEARVQMGGEFDDMSMSFEAAQNHLSIQETVQALEYTTRPDDPVFRKLSEMNEYRLDSEIQIMTENRATGGIRDWLEANEDMEMRERTLVGLNAMKENAREHLSHAVETGDLELYRETLDHVSNSAGEYAEILGNQGGEIWVEEKPEHPVRFTEIEAADFDERKRLHLDRAAEFAGRYEQAVEHAAGNSDAVMSLADDLLQYYQAQLEEAAEYEGSFDQNFRHLDRVAEAMTGLLREKQSSP